MTKASWVRNSLAYENAEAGTALKFQNTKCPPPRAVSSAQIFCSVISHRVPHGCFGTLRGLTSNVLTLRVWRKLSDNNNRVELDTSHIPAACSSSSRARCRPSGHPCCTAVSLCIYLPRARTWCAPHRTRLVVTWAHEWHECVCVFYSSVVLLL